MFILRKITGDGNEVNICLGESYNFVDSERHQSFFNATMSIWTKDVKTQSDDSIYAFIVHSGGCEIIPLYRNHQNYVMVGNGQTFANLTFK